VTRRKPEPEEAVAAIRKAGETGDFEMGPRDTIENYTAEVETICEALGRVRNIRVDFLSDMSSISDFHSRSHPSFGSYFDELSSELGVPVADGEMVIEICRRLRQKAEAGSA